MITGYVSADREAIIPLRLRGVGGVELEINAVLDTGFDDYLILPPDIVEAMGFPFVDTSRALLADGNLVRFDIHRATVVWNEERRVVPAQVASGGVLIGMGLMYGNIVTIDVTDGGDVTLEER